MVAFLLFGAVAIVALSCADGRKPRVYAILKPVGTMCLLPVAGLPGGRFGAGVVVALVLSALGDAALHRKHQRPWFLAGMGCFMLAHGVYTAAFLLGGGARATAGAAGVTILAGVGAVAVLRRVWAGIHPTLRAPCVIYGLIITAMLGSASTLLLGPWPESTTGAVLVGGVLFYIGDVALALSLFGRPFPGNQSISMGLYWLGQLGFALAARWQGGLGW